MPLLSRGTGSSVWPNEVFHILVRLDEKKSSVVCHLALQLFRDIPRVGDDNTVDIFVHLPKDIPIVSVCGRERKGEESAVVIPCHHHFKPIVEAFSGLSPRCEPFHRLVLGRVLVEAHGEVSCVRVLHEMPVLSSHPHDVEENTESEECHALYRDHKRFVRAGTL